MPRVRRHQKVFWTLLIAGTFVIILHEVLDTSNVSFSSVVMLRRSENNLTFEKYIEAAAEKVKTCAGHKIPEIRFENGKWQTLKASNITFKMFNAYYDERDFYARQKQSVVKIIALIDQKVGPKVETFCQLWFDGFSAPVVSKVYEYTLMWHESWGVNGNGSQPYLVTCLNPLVNLGLIPSAISLAVQDCEIASNYLRVIYNPPEIGKVKPIAVCVRLYDRMQDQAAMIVEWIEILQLLGVDKVFVYVANIHPKMMKVLSHYEIAGKVKVEKISLPEGLPDKNQSHIQRLQNDLIPYNDCLFKNMYDYHFLVPLDIDEIILPTRQDLETWSDLLTHVIQAGRLVKDELFSGYVAFLPDDNDGGDFQPDMPADQVFMQNVHRAVNFSEKSVGMKSFQNTRTVAVVHSHFPMHCLGKNLCDYFYIPTATAQLQHYRRGCGKNSQAECEDLKNRKDLELWKFKDELLENVNETLRALA